MGGQPTYRVRAGNSRSPEESGQWALMRSPPRAPLIGASCAMVIADPAKAARTSAANLTLNSRRRCDLDHTANGFFADDPRGFIALRNDA